MATWEETLNQLKEEYLRGSKERLNRIERSLNFLANDKTDGEALRALRREFHGLSGSGTTYGFPQVTALGLQGEQECDHLLQEDLQVSVADLNRWESILDSLRLEFSAMAPATAPVLERIAPAASESPDILVVDDDPDILRTVIHLIESEGMSARTASSKSDAMIAFKDRTPDGSVIDILLPDGSGYELVEYLRDLPGGENAVILMISGYTGFLDKVEAIRCGADGYFDKPVDWEALLRRLQHLLNKRKSESPRILSVEDDPDQASFIRTILESAGYEVRLCEDPKRFETDLVAFRPDLLLMDVLLPVISGYDLVRFLRQDERYSTLPIIFLTTQSQVQARIETVKAGGDDHLIKPVPPGLLLSSVAARIERSRFLKSLVDRDGLTRLLNHSAFLERAKVAMAKARRNVGESIALAIIDLDHFKSVNDRHGRLVGDRVLVSLSTLLLRRLRQTDIIGRYGGEEFAVIIEDLNTDEAVRLLSRLSQEFSAVEHAISGGQTFRVTFSAGIAMWDPQTVNVDEWIARADQALYAAKEAGRNRVVLHTK